MQQTILALFALPISLIGVAANYCNANNCARAVTGTRYGKLPDVSSRKADCSSFQHTTYTPAATTITVTVTVTLTPSLTKRGLQARETAAYRTCPVPTYAAACKDKAEYASACSCWGITATTTTLPTPTAYKTVYTTVTAPPPSGCTGKTCGTYQTWRCAGSPTGNCLCGIDAAGANFCFQDDRCAREADCSVNADCKAGQRCLTQSCCQVSKCVTEAAGNCGNPNAPRAIFDEKKRAEAAAGCNSGAC